MSRLSRSRTRQAQKAVLHRLRRRIDALDLRLLVLLAKRQELTRQIGHVKSHLRIAVRDQHREMQMLAQQRAHIERLALDPALAERVFRTILRLSKRAQQQLKRDRGAKARGSS